MRLVRTRLTIGVLAGALALTGLLAPATGAPEAAAAGEREVVARTGVLTTRPAGLPAPGAAQAQQIESAKVRQDIEGYRAQATVVLRGEPGPAATLAVGFGAADGSNCVSQATFTTPTDDVASGFTRAGRTIRLDADSVDARVGDWDCAFVATSAADGTTYDALVGGLDDVHGKAVLEVGAVYLLHRKQKRLGLVRGVWTPIDVAVENTSDYEATKVEVVGGGKGVKVRPGKVGWMNRHSTTTARVQVKLTGRAGTVRLTVRGAGAKAGSRSLKVRAVKPPRRPVPGSYRASADPGTLSFRIAGGKVVGFRARGVRMTCRTPGEYPTHRTVNLRYPRKVAVPRSGIVDVLHRWREGDAWYRAYLRMRANGSRITQGNFTYVTANWCQVDEDFTARR